jgi:hypothetical protein
MEYLKFIGVLYVSDNDEFLDCTSSSDLDWKAVATR